MPFDNAPLCGSTNRGGFVATVDQLDRGKSELGMGYTLAASGVAVPLTGTVAETVLASFTLPGGLMGPNGLLRITSYWTCTNNANNKVARIRLAGWNMQSYTATTLSQLRISTLIFNRGVENSQVLPAGSTAFADGTTTTGIGASTIDTSQDQVITFGALLASAADTIQLEAYLVEVFPS